MSLADKIETLKESVPINSFHVVLDFILTYKDSELDGVEMQLLMLIASLELISVAYTQKIANSYLENSQIALPHSVFIPDAMNGHLSTSRYRAVNHFIKNVIQICDGNADHLRGGSCWREHTSNQELRSLNIDKAKLHISPKLIGTQWYTVLIYHFRIAF